MRILKRLTFCILTLSIFACSNDDDGGDMNCTGADWAGVYVGTITCDGNEQTVTVTITTSGENIAIQHVSASSTVTYDPLPFTNCSLSEMAVDAGVTITIDANLDGDRLTINESISGGGVSGTCAITADRN